MVELGPPLPSQLCYGPGNEASWTLGEKQPFPLPPGDFEGCYGSPGPVRIEGWRAGHQRVSIIWYALSVNLHELCMRHTACNVTWYQSFA